MDARSVARAAGVPLATLNVWSQRGQLPGLLPGVRGRRRDIDRETAIGIAIFAQMMNFGVSPDTAAGVVKVIAALDFEARFVVVPPPHEEVIIPPEKARSPIRPSGDRTFTVSEAAPSTRWPARPPRWRLPAGVTEEVRRKVERSLLDLEQAQRLRVRVVFTAEELARVFDDVEQPPSSYLIIDVARIAWRVQRAEAEWNRSREGKE